MGFFAGSEGQRERMCRMGFFASSEGHSEQKYTSVKSQIMNQ
ncbi:hypothetical protein [Myroides sp. C4067]